MALYVLPRAIRTCIPERWVRAGNKPARVVESAVAVISLAYLLTAAKHDSSSLRGLSRWTLAFVTRGTVARFKPLK